MKKFLLLFYILFGIIALSAKVNPDSLALEIDKSIINKKVNPSTLIKIRSLAEFYHKSDWDKSFFYYGLLENLTIEYNLDYWSIGLAIKGKGNLYYEKGEYSKAIDEYYRALDLYELKDDELNIADMYSYIAYIYLELDDFKSAVNLYNIAKEINKKFVNKYYKDGYIHNLLMLASIELKKNNCKNAQSLINESLKVSVSLKDSLKIVRSNIHLARALSGQKEFEKALNVIEESLQILTATRNIKDEFLRVQYHSTLLFDKAEIHTDLKNLDIAISVLADAKMFSIKNKYLEGELKSNIKLGKLYFLHNYYKKSILILSNVLEDNRFNKYRNYKIDCYELLSRANEEIGRYKKALIFSRVKESLVDSVKSTDIIQKINQLQLIYNSEKQKQEKVALENKIAAEQREKYLIIISSVIIGVFLILLLLKHLRTIRINKTLEKYNEEKQTLIGIMAHDLRNPFSNFLGYTDLLYYDQSNLDKNTREEVIKEINNSAHRYYDLLNNLLSWIKSQSKDHKLNIDKFLLKSSLSKLISVYDSLIVHKKIKIEYLMEEDFVIYSDENILSAILRNLINNAIKFTNPEGVIKIGASLKNNNYVISINDDGVGMTDQQLNDYLNYNSASTDGTNKEKGTGFGMKIIKSMLDKLGAELKAESKPGNGTTIKIILPKGN